MIFPSLSSLLIQIFVYLAVPAAIATFCCACLFAFGRRLFPNKDFSAIERTAPYAESLIFGFVGACIGLMASSSRTPVMGDVLPALLSAFGVLATLYFSGKESASRGLLVSLSLILSVSTILGAVVGGQIRETAQSSTEAIRHRAELVAFCKLEEQRAGQIVQRGGGKPDTEIDLKCSEYPRY